MVKRALPNERSPARYPEEAFLPNRWNPPTSPTYLPPPNHAGLSRQPFHSRDPPEYGWGARSARPLDTTSSPDTWFPNNRDMPRPAEGFARSSILAGLPMAAAATVSYGVGPPMASDVPLLDSSRSSDEEWRRFEDDRAIPRNAPIPSMMHASAHAPASFRDPPPITPSVQPAPSAAAAQSADPDPPRARVACTFCRARKLRCDGATPCRHCERRSIDCVYAPNKGKAKGSARAPSSPGKGNHASLPNDQSKSKHAEMAHTGASERERGRKRRESSNTFDAHNGSFSASDASQTDSSKRFRKSSDQERRYSPVTTSDQSRRSSATSASSPSSSMPGSDLAMIQNNDAPIPMEPTFGVQEDWWNQLLAIFGRSRATSMRMVRHLLTRFVQSNAVFFGLLHAPTLLNVVSGSHGHTHGDPVLYLAVLAVSAFDMHQDRIADERTGDMRAANEASRRLASRLSDMAANYLQTSTAHGSALSPSIGQAASILALTQPDGSTEQSSLIRLAENVVRILRLHERVSSREPLLQDSEPDSPLYWSRPVTSHSPESEVKYESIVRLCWTGISHRFRKYIAKPDEDFGDVDLPEYILEIRPMAFWQPSLLPYKLPPPFFHSQDLMRRSAHLSRLAVSLSKLQKIKEVPESSSPTPEMLEEVKGILRALDRLEKAFVRHRPRSDAEKQNVLGRTLQMFCRMHVWVRLTIWRKYRLWTWPGVILNSINAVDTVVPDATQASSAQEPPQQQQQSQTLFPLHHPTIEFWLGIVQEMITAMQQDLDAHVIDQTALRTTVSDVDTLVRHTICTFDLIEATGNTQPLLVQIDAALSILKRVLAYAALNTASNGLHITDEITERMQAAEARRASYQIAAAAADTFVSPLDTRISDGDLSMGDRSTHVNEAAPILA